MNDMQMLYIRRSFYFCLFLFEIIIFSPITTASGFEKQTTDKHLYVCNYLTDKVSIYDASANGDQTPLKIFGDITDLLGPQSLALDTRTSEIYVANSPYSVTIYGMNDHGNISPRRTIYSLTNYESITVNFQKITIDETRNELYVLDRSNSTIGVFSLSGKGNVKPLRIISHIIDRISPVSIAYDSIHNEFFIASDNRKSIYVYDGPMQDVHGVFYPKREIGGMSKVLKDPSDVAIDPINNEVFIADGTNNSIFVFERTGDRHSLPIRTITGNNTCLTWPRRIVVDPANNEIYVANWGGQYYNTITVYERTARGDAKPLRIIRGDKTGLNVPTMALNKNNGELTVVNYENNSITVYKKGAANNTAPIRTIAGTMKGRNGIRNIAVDEVRGEIYISNSKNDSISIYKISASGNEPPVRTIEGHLTEMSEPYGIFLDINNKELFVANNKNNSITVYQMLANGNTAPLRKIAGTSTGLEKPYSIVLNAKQKEIYVTNSANSSITIYNSNSNGDAKPLRAIVGIDTELKSPNGIALDSNRRQRDLPGRRSLFYSCRE